jgi:DNA polymerase-1
MSRERPLLVLFDGNALVHRAFHAMKERPLTVSKTGERVEAVYGFTRTVLKVLRELQPSHWAIAFDRPTPTFRHRELETYKEGRPRTPDELVSQFQRVRQLVQTLNIPVFEVEGYEADDVLGTLARQASAQDMEVVIVTGDMDAVQLISPQVRVLMPQRNLRDTVVYDERAVQERYGINPAQIPDLKGLIGDPSDKLPGLPGVGEKTAARLLQQFGSVEGIYRSLHQVTPPKLKETLEAEEEKARQNKRLATIVVDVPTTFEPSRCKVGEYDRHKLLELLRELEFYSLLSSLPEIEEPPRQGESGEKGISTAPQGEYQLITTPEALDRLARELSSAGTFALHLVTAPEAPGHSWLVGIALSPAPGKAYYLPVGHRGGEEQLPWQQVMTRLKPLLEEPDIPKVAYDGKTVINTLANLGVQLANLGFDPMIAAYLLGDRALELRALALSWLGLEIPSPEARGGARAKRVSAAEMPVALMAQQACMEVDISGRLRPVLEQKLQEGELEKLFAQVEMPLVPVLASMERHGIALDTSLLGQMSQSLGGQLLKLEKEIYDSVGHSFNINSPQQLSAVLFEELKLPPARRTKSGYSTDASVLEGLREAHPVVPAILEYRQLAKLKSTYIDALPALINPETGRVHTKFNQTVTTTGRLSSSDPNLQNIPVRGELGKQLRKAFIAASPYLLLAADYSQIDLRVLAHLSQDPGLLEAFQKEEDIHLATAAQIFAVSPAEVTPDMRRLAKTVNFGVIYGISAYGLEQATELSREEATRFIESYFEKHPKVREYIESTKQQARERGYVQTLLGRRRYLPEINSSNQQIREAAERMAINMPVQGTAADIIKLAMIQLYQEMERRKLESRMILQVHDELLFEVPPEEVEEMKRLVEEIMPHALELSVPLKVEAKLGKSWGEME